MKKCFTILFLFLTLLARSQITDKQAHFIVGSWCGACCYVIGNNTSETQYNGNAIQIKAITYGISGAVLLGTGKEFLWDKLYQRGRFDIKDLGYTVAGGVATVVFITGVKYVIKIFKHKHR
jgi:hypothetical protein